MPSPKRSRRWLSVPHSIGDRTPAGGGTCAAIVRKKSPRNPSGVQLASAIVPPGRVTRSSSAATRSWSGANIEPKTDVTASNEASANGSASASPSDELDRQPLRGRPQAGTLEQGRHVVDPDGLDAQPRGGDGGVAAAGRDVQDAPAGVEVGRVDEPLGDDHDPRRDGVVVAARPGLLLPLLHGRRGPASGVGVSRVVCHLLAPFAAGAALGGVVARPRSAACVRRRRARVTPRRRPPRARLRALRSPASPARSKPERGRDGGWAARAACARARGGRPCAESVTPGNELV